MDNKKMIRTVSNFDIFAKVGGKISLAAGVVCIVVAVFTLVFGSRMFAEGGMTLDLDFVKLYLNDNIAADEKFIRLYVVVSTLGASVICFLLYYIAGILRKIFAPMKNGRPFEAGISNNLRKIGWAVIACGLASEVLGVVARVLLAKAYSIEHLFASEAVAKTEFVFTMDFNFVLIALAVFLLSYIFSYGQMLQQESDETL